MVIFAVCIWILSLAQAKENLLARGLGDFGLITILPISYYIALSLLTISFLISLKSIHRYEKLHLLQLIILIFFLYLTPQLIEETRLRYAISSFSPSDYIISYGMINQSTIVYHNWPGFHILASIVIELSRIGPMAIVRSNMTAPLLMILPVLLILYNKILKCESAEKWVCIWIYFIIQWVNRDFWSSQTAGFILLIIILYLLFSISYQNVEGHSAKPNINILFFLIFSQLVIMHLLSASIAFFIIILFIIFKFINKKSVFLLLLSIILISWIIYGSFNYFNSNFNTYLDQAFNIDFIFHSNLEKRVSGNSDRILIEMIRIAYSILVIFLALSGLNLSLKNFENRETDYKILMAILGIAGSAIFLSYGGELFMRIWWMSSILIPYYVIKNLNHKVLSAALSIFLILSPPLFIISRYGGEIYDYVPYSELNGVDFFYKRIDNAAIVGSSELQYKDIYNNYSNIYFDFSKNFVDASDIHKKIINSKSKGSIFLQIHRGLRIFYQRLNKANIDEFQDKIDKFYKFNKIYSNPNYELYKLEV